MKYNSYKVCFKCKTTKPLLEFYRSSQIADGFLNKCKECTKKDTKENKDKHPEYYAEYDRQRALSPHRVLARLAYSQTEAGKVANRRSKKKWIESNPVKRSAQIIVGNAVRDGKLIKPAICSECNKTGAVHGHHDNYAFPLIVRWLCSDCHAQWHKMNEPINGINISDSETQLANIPF